MPVFMRVKEGWARPSVAAILLSLAWVLPVALAVSSNGSLTVSSLTLPPEANSTLGFLGLVHNDAANLSGSLHSEKVTLCKYEVRYVEVANSEHTARLPLSMDVQESCFPQTNVTITLRGDPGWVGLRPRAGGTADLTSTHQGTVEPRAISTLGSKNADHAGSGDARQPWFSHVVSRDHLLYSTTGAIAYQGDGELRFLGPDARVLAAENATPIDYRTGQETRGGILTAHEVVVRWITVHYDAATVTLEATTPLLLAARDVLRLSWDGNATAANIRGTLQAGRVEYAPARDGEMAYLDGIFTGSIAPKPDSNGEAAMLHIEGDLRATSLRATPAPLPSTSALPEWAGLLAIGAVVVTGGILAYQRSIRLHARPDHGIESRVEGDDLAIALADSGRWREAADALATCTRGTDANERLILQRGIFLYKAGDFRNAIACFERLAGRTEAGEWAYWAASAALGMGREDLAEMYVLRALSTGAKRSVLGWFVGDPAFAAILRNPDVEAALRE